MYTRHAIKYAGIQHLMITYDPMDTLEINNRTIGGLSLPTFAVD